MSESLEMVTGQSRVINQKGLIYEARDTATFSEVVPSADVKYEIR